MRVHLKNNNKELLNVHMYLLAHWSFFWKFIQNLYNKQYNKHRSLFFKMTIGSNLKKWWIGEMVQWVQVFAAKPEDLRLFFRTHMTERTNSCKLSSWLPHVCHDMIYVLEIEPRAYICSLNTLSLSFSFIFIFLCILRSLIFFVYRNETI